MEQKAVVVTFHPQATDEEIREALRKIEELGDVEYVTRPTEINPEHGEPVVYVP
jgi:hypothetical protein